MTGRDMVSGLSFIEERFINELEEEPPKMRLFSRRWRNIGKGVATAAGLLLITGAAVMVQQIAMREDASGTLPEITASESMIKPAVAQGDGTETLFAGGKVTNEEQKENELISGMCDEEVQECVPEAVIEENTFEMMCLNEIEEIQMILYSHNENVRTITGNSLEEYYGKNPEPQYVPEDMKASGDNGKADVALDEYENVIYDLVSYKYYEDHPDYDWNNKTGRYLVVTISKTNHKPAYHAEMIKGESVQTTEIAGMDVMLGYQKMWYAVSDTEVQPDERMEEIYTAEFQKDGMYYQIIAAQMQLTELMAVIESVP